MLLIQLIMLLSLVTILLLVSYSLKLKTVNNANTPQNITALTSKDNIYLYDSNDYYQSNDNNNGDFVSNNSHRYSYEPQSFLIYYIFTILTCGIYYLYFTYKTQESLYDKSNKNIEPIIMLLIAFLLNGAYTIVHLIRAYLISKQIDRAQDFFQECKSIIILYIIGVAVSVGSFIVYFIISSVTFTNSIQSDSFYNNGVYYETSGLGAIAGFAFIGIAALITWVIFIICDYKAYNKFCEKYNEFLQE